MKTFDELTNTQQKQAIERCLTELVQGILDEYISFDLDQGTLQYRIDAAIKKANDMRTPWFAAEYILSSCEQELRSIARYEAEGCLYSTPDDPRVIVGIIHES